MVELLTAMTILAVVMLLMSELLNQVQKSWRFGEDRISQFREARVAFDLMTKNMSQATMNTYWDYEYDSDGFVRDYRKRTELHFYNQEAESIEGQIGMSGKTNGHAIFFQAPLGDSYRYRNLNNLFNGRGYMVIHDSDEALRPSIVETEKHRFRLMEFRPPAEFNQVFQDAIDELLQSESTFDVDQVFQSWWKHSLSEIDSNAFQDYLNPLAENIVLLVATPMDTLESTGGDRYKTGSRIAPSYIFDSNEPEILGTGQMVPPLMKVTMVAIDESSAVQLEEVFGSAKPDIIPRGLFKNSDDFTDDVTKLVEHFDELNREDNGYKINFKIFSATVLLRAAKWVTE